MALEAKNEKRAFSPARKVGLKEGAERHLGKIREMAAALLEEAKFLDPKSDLAEVSATDFFEDVRRFEIRLIKHALRLAGGNHARAAKMLGLGVSTLKYKIKTYADSEEFRKSVKSIRELGFAGMWAHRADIKDGVSYVNSLRDSPRA